MEDDNYALFDPSMKKKKKKKQPIDLEVIEDAETKKENDITADLAGLEISTNIDNGDVIGEFDPSLKKKKKKKAEFDASEDVPADNGDIGDLDFSTKKKKKKKAVILDE